MNEIPSEATGKVLRDTNWLAKRLNLSVTTIERFRAKGSSILPPAIRIGSSIRYDEDIVDAWLKRRMEDVVAERQANQTPTTDQVPSHADQSTQLNQQEPLPCSTT